MAATRGQLQDSLERLEAVDAKALGVVIILALEVETDARRSRGEATARAKAQARASTKGSRSGGRRRA